MTDIAARLNEAADHLDYLYEGAKHIPTDLIHDRDFRMGLVNSESHEPGPPVAQFFWGGAAEVFLALGPASLPLLVMMLRAEAVDVTLCDAINNRDPDNDGKTRVMYRATTTTALALADHILKTKES